MIGAQGVFTRVAEIAWEAAILQNGGEPISFEDEGIQSAQQVFGDRLLEYGNTMNPMGQPDFMVLGPDDVSALSDWLKKSDLPAMVEANCLIYADPYSDVPNTRHLDRLLSCPLTWRGWGEGLTALKLSGPPTTSIEGTADRYNHACEAFVTAFNESGLDELFFAPVDAQSWVRCVSVLSLSQSYGADAHLTGFLAFLNSQKWSPIEFDAGDDFDEDKTRKIMECLHDTTSDDEIYISSILSHLLKYPTFSASIIKYYDLDRFTQPAVSPQGHKEYFEHHLRLKSLFEKPSMLELVAGEHQKHNSQGGAVTINA